MAILDVQHDTEAMYRIYSVDQNSFTYTLLVAQSQSSSDKRLLSVILPRNWYFA